jgi:lipid II:glycine glycyltransferase (peptidoglycan interpeptide bridge formation enzyme)
VQTAYGYGGVLMVGPSSDHAVHEFNVLVDEWMQDHKVVAEFIRLLPDLNLKKIRKSTYVPVRKDIFLDLAGFTEESIWEKLLSSKSRNMIRKSQKENLQIFLEKDLEASFNDFVRIYQEFAQRIEMDPFYFFSDAYFRSFQIHMQDFVLLAHAKKDGKICASSVWLCYHDMIHYYLGTTDKAYTHLPCSDAYIWGVIRSMLESGVAKVIHFGGGMSMDPDDTLFRFKAKYANRSEVVYISKRIHNDSIYRMLCDQWAQKNPHLVPKHGQKLLRYRERNNA